MALQNLATVRRTIRLALDKAKTDKQTLYLPEVLRALELLKINRPGEWESRKEDVKALKVSLQLLQRATFVQSFRSWGRYCTNGSANCWFDTSGTSA